MYGQYDVDWDRIPGVQGAFPGWLSFDLAEITNQFGGCWQTTHFHASDAIIFTMFTFHCGLDYTTDRFRISADVRHQAASAAADERWVGENPTGNHEAHLLQRGEIKPVGSYEDARRLWSA